MPGEAWEDIGYGAEPMDKSYKMHKFSGADKVKIEYLRGDWRGRVFWIKRSIAEDLIERGMAKEVE